MSTDHRRGTPSRPRVLGRLGAVSFAAALLVACGDDDGPPATIAPAVTAITTTVAPTAAGNGNGY